MAAEKGIKKILRRLAEKLVQGDIHSLNVNIIDTALDKTLEKLPELYHSEIIKHKDLYTNLLQSYIEDLSSEKYQFDLPYNLYLSKEQCKVDQLSDSGKQKDILIKNLLQKKFLSSSSADIMQSLSVTGNKWSKERTPLLLVEDLYTLKTISGRLTDLESLLKLMSVSCQVFMLSANMSIDTSIRKQINSAVESLLITCKTRFVNFENLSQEETTEYYDYLAALSCLYVQSIAMMDFKPNTGKKLSNFITYMLKNSLQHQLDLILQIDRKLANVKILLPLISKTFTRCENLSCEMYLRYILAARHVQKQSNASEIKSLKRKCLHLKIPATFYKWLTTHLPNLKKHLDEEDNVVSYLMNCPEDIFQSLIILLSRKPREENKNEFKTEVDKHENEDKSQGDVSDAESSDSKTECSFRKRKSPSNVLFSNGVNDLPQKRLRFILGE